MPEHLLCCTFCVETKTGEIESTTPHDPPPSLSVQSVSTLTDLPNRRQISNMPSSLPLQPRHSRRLFPVPLVLRRTRRMKFSKDICREGQHTASCRGISRLNIFVVALSFVQDDTHTHPADPCGKRTRLPWITWLYPHESRISTEGRNGS